MQVEYHVEAEQELIDAVRYYDTRSPGVGLRLIHEYEMALARVVEAPDRWERVTEKVRRHLLNVFPYGVYYFVKVDCIFVVAVAHHKRHPDYWKQRLLGT